MANTFEKIKQVVSAIESPRVFGIAAFLVIAAAIPLTIYVAQKQQETRQRASEVSSTPPPCQAVPTDTMLITDRSGSMVQNGSDKLVKAKEGAKIFVDNIARDARNKIGLVSFSTNSALDSAFVNDFASVKNKIEALQGQGWTCTQCAVKRANQEIENNKNDGLKKVVILLTDGIANTILSSTPPIPVSPFPTITFPPLPTSFPPITKNPFPIDQPVLGDSTEEQEPNSIVQDGVRISYGQNGEITRQVPPFEAEQKAIDAVMEGKNANNTVFYTIGLGADVNSAFLQRIANSTGGKYYFAPTPDQLNSIYFEIYLTIGRGSVNGSVYNDANSNGVFDSGETKLNNWTVDLKSGSTSIGTANTGSTGDFSMTNICDGSYNLSQQVKSGFVQTEPPNSGSHPITIQNGNAITNKNFGNKIATPTEITLPPPTITPTPTCTNKPPGCTPDLPACGIPMPPGGWCEDKGTTLELDLKLQSIGTDAAHPNNVVLNSRPVHEERDVIVEVFNSVDNRVQAIVATASGKVRYDRTSGTFKGIVPVSGISTTGDYAIKVTVDKFLRKLIGRETQQPVFRIVVGQSNAIPQTTLIAGDLNGDNRLNIIDYVNYWLPCHNKSMDTRVPDTNKTCAVTDINDDGQVDHDNDENADNINMRDYRWLYNSFQVQEGD